MKCVICTSVFLAVCLLSGCVSVKVADKGPFNVRTFGAKGDGKTKDTAALQRALDACAAAGGGTVRVPEGVYLTGSLVVRANTTLRLEQHANIVGSPNIGDYPLVRVRWEGEFRDGHRALICADNAANITIEGSGVIFGPPLMESRLRDPRGPLLIELTGCTNTVLENFTTEYQQLWSIHALFCENFTARNLTIRTVNANGDGVDVDSCSDVIIDHCDINTGDDAISLKSGRGLSAAQLDRPTRNVTIEHCTLASSSFAALGVGTELSGGIRNVKLEDCIISGRQNAIYLKSRDGRGGFIENLTGENLTINNSPTFIGIDLLKKGIQANDPVPGDAEKWTRMSNISFNHIRVNNVAELVAGKNIPAEQPVDGFTITDVTGTCNRGLTLANMTHAKLAGIKLTGIQGPLVTVENVTGEGLDGTAAK
jgi:polygalacturonase